MEICQFAFMHKSIFVHMWYIIFPCKYKYQYWDISITYQLYLDKYGCNIANTFSIVPLYMGTKIYCFALYLFRSYFDRSPLSQGNTLVSWQISETSYTVSRTKWNHWSPMMIALYDSQRYALHKTVMQYHYCHQPWTCNIFLFDARSVELYMRLGAMEDTRHHASKKTRKLV